MQWPVGNSEFIMDCAERRHNSAASRFGRRAFTLIELLAVIAIIALLMAILTPALSRAINTARDIHCRSNLRQIGMAIHLYTVDHRGLLPPTGFFGLEPGYNRDPRRFVNHVRQYLDLPEAENWETNPFPNYAPIFACPSFKGPRDGKCYLLTRYIVTPSGIVQPWGYVSDAQGHLSLTPQPISHMPPDEIAIKDMDHVLEISHEDHRNALGFDVSVRSVQAPP